MSTTGDFERAAIVDRAKQLLVGGRVYTAVPDDAQVTKSPNGTVLPYLVIDFGNAYAIDGDRSLMGEADQPHLLPLRVEAWAATGDVAEKVAGAVREQFIGWHASPSSSEISSASGGGFSTRSSNAAPSRAVETVALELTFNLGSNDGYAVNPGSPNGGTEIETIRDIVLEILGEETKSFERHDFPNPVGQWSMVHAFGRIPSVATYSLTGERLLSDVNATTSTVLVTWANPTAGFVILT
jgi:hypothetical protein